jgi:translation initiation factor IF-2
VSGKSGEGIDVLVESLLLQADVMELRAASEGQAEATVLDANMEKGRGVVADVLVQVL